MTEVTKILSAMQRGDYESAEKLLPLVYDQLRRLAAAKLAHEKSGHSLQPTALVHEAYLRLVESEKTDSLGEFEAAGLSPRWNGKAHFFGAASEAMRRILVENARRKKRTRHGGQVQHRPMDDNDASVLSNKSGEEFPPDRILDLHEALSRLEQQRPQIGELVKLRFFGGLTSEQAAAALSISPATAKRNWAYAKAWLRREMDREIPLNE